MGVSRRKSKSKRNRRYKNNRSRKRNFSLKRRSFKKLRGGSDYKFPFTDLDDFYNQINSRLNNVGGLPFGVEEFKKECMKLKGKIKKDIITGKVNNLKEKVNSLKSKYLPTLETYKTKFNTLKDKNDIKNLKQNVSEIMNLIEDFKDDLNKIFLQQKGGSRRQLRPYDPDTDQPEAEDDEGYVNCGICFSGIDADNPGYIIRHPKMFGIDTEHKTYPVHRDCIRRWIQENPTCPACRIPMDMNNLNDDQLDDVVIGGEIIGTFWNSIKFIMVIIGALYFFKDMPTVGTIVLGIVYQILGEIINLLSYAIIPVIFIFFGVAAGAIAEVFGLQTL